MNKKEYCILDEICSYVNNRTSNVDYYISTENMLPNKGGVCEAANVPSGTVIEYKVGDILISNIRPYFQKIWRADRNGGCSADVLCIRAKENVDSKYLYYLLSQQAFFDYVMSGAKGCKMPRGDKKQIMQWPVTLPPLEEQRRIAGILGSLDDKIELNRRINANLEAQAQALFINISRTYPTQKGILKDLIEIKYGKDHKKLNVGNIPVYGSGGIMRYVDTSIYEKETVLIPRKGSLNNVIYLNTPFWSVDTMFYSVMKYDHIAKYVYFFLKSKDLSAMNAGSAVPSMTTDILYQMEINIPDKTVFETYDTIVSPLFKQIQVNQEENQSLSALRDTLLPKLMAGEINIENQ